MKPGYRTEQLLPFIQIFSVPNQRHEGVIISGFMTSIFVIFSNKAQIKSLQNKNRILTEELNELRNVAIDEGIYESDDGDY